MGSRNRRHGFGGAEDQAISITEYLIGVAIIALVYIAIDIAGCARALNRIADALDDNDETDDDLEQ